MATTSADPEVPIYHYTMGSHLKGILKDHAIHTAAGYVPPGERAVVWCTTRPDWEPTATKDFLDRSQKPKNMISKMTREQAEKHFGGLIRIQVKPEAAPMRWPEYVPNSGIDPGLADTLARTGRAAGSDPADWRMSFEPIVENDWISIEWKLEDAWVPYRTNRKSDI